MLLIIFCDFFTLGSHLRLYASAANGRKNAKNRATVNNNNNNTNESTAKKLTQNASAKAVQQQSNFVNKEQPIKTTLATSIKQVDDKSKTEKPATTILYSKNVKENAQNKLNDDDNKGKSNIPGKIVKPYDIFFGFLLKIYLVHTQIL